MRTIKYILGLVAVVFLVAITKAQPSFNWAAPQHGTSTTTDASTSYSVYEDAQGHIYTIGVYVGNVDFDPGPGVMTINNSSVLDVYISKIDANGNLIWVKTIATNSTGLWAYKVIGDNQGGIYLTGVFQSTVDFNPGPGVFNLSSNGYTDAYVLKLDTAGTFQWAKSFGGTNFDHANSMYFNTANNQLVVVGDFSATVDFNPAAPIYNLTANSTDAYAMSLDQSGNFLWAKQFTGASAEYIYDITGNANGDLFVAGFFYNTIDVDPSPSSTILTSLGTADGYVSKLDATGNLIWATQLGGAATTTKNWGIDITASGVIYFSGDFNNTLQYTDVNSTTFSPTTNGGLDMLVGSLNSTGDILWVKQIGGTGTDRALEIACRGNSVYIGGFYSTIVDFDPGPGTFNLPTAGSGSNASLFSLTNNGDFLWAYGIGNTDGGSLDADEIKGIVVSPTGEIYSTGYFRGSNTPVDLDPTTGVYNSTGAFDNHNSFTLKLGCTPATSTDVVSACNTYTWIDNNTYTTNNTTATHRIPGGAFTGCDSIVTLNLTINNATAGTDVQTACGSYTWIDNNTYTVSNSTATHTITGGAFNGCDSVVTLNLTINNATAGTDVQTACGSYTWIDNNTYTANNTTATHTITGGAFNGCDSIVTLNLTINNATTGTDVQTACDTYTWIDNNTYTSNNTTATHTLVGGNSVGCDSVVTLNLTINTVDNTTTNVNDSITANATGATYQWLDCDNSFAIISGATNQLFVASANGNYAVQVTQNGCTDTSGCVNITTIGVDKITPLNLSVYPNPTTGNITIQLEKTETNITFLVRNIMGQVIETKTYHSTNKIDYNFNGESGIYFIELSSANKEKITLKIIKQ